MVTFLLEQVYDNEMIETKRFNEQLIEALQNDDIANKKAFFETELCRYMNDNLEKIHHS